MSSQERVKKEEAAARANLWVKVVTKEDLERYENIKKEEEIKRHENILQELKKQERNAQNTCPLSSVTRTKYMTLKEEEEIKPKTPN